MCLTCFLFQVVKLVSSEFLTHFLYTVFFVIFVRMKAGYLKNTPHSSYIHSIVGHNVPTRPEKHIRTAFKL